MDSLAACKTSVCCPMFNFLPGVVRDALHSSIPFFDRLILALQQNFNIEKIERKSRDKEECRRKKITGSSSSSNVKLSAIDWIGQSSQPATIHDRFH